MDTIFMNSENSKTTDPYVLILKLSDKLDLRSGAKSIALSNFSIQYTWKNRKSSYNNNKFKISAPTWNDEFELPDRLYSISDIQDYFEYILKKHGENIDNPSIKIYINKIENKIIFKVETGYYLELLIHETIKLRGSTENKITKDKTSENVPHLEITSAILVHCNIVNKCYQKNSRVFYTFVPKKPFGNLLEFFPKNHVVLKTFNSKFQAIEVWFTNQNIQPLEIEDRIYLALITR